MIAALLVAAALAQDALPTKPVAPATAPSTSGTPSDAAGIFARALAAVGPVSNAPCLRAEGVIETAEGRSEVTMLWNARPPRRIVVRERLPGGGIAEWGCDATRGWIRVPGRAELLELEPGAVLAVRAALVPSNMVMALADRFPIRNAVTDETLDGVACRRVELEDRDGLPGTAWFEVESGRLRAFRTLAARGETPAMTTIEAWADAGALHLPARLTLRSGDRVVRTSFTRFSVDPLSDSAFAPPATTGVPAADPVKP